MCPICPYVCSMFARAHRTHRGVRAHPEDLMRVRRRDTCQEAAAHEQALTAAAGVMVNPRTGGGPGGECTSPGIRRVQF
jgi:hypothetical protein